jgi:hypothetical protein
VDEWVMVECARVKDGVTDGRFGFVMAAFAVKESILYLSKK